MPATQNIETKRKAATRFIRPDVLSRISSLSLVAKGVVEGFISGLHRSPYKGFSVDFVEYRPYMPGDDLLRIDWKAYARTDRLFIKEFEDETNTHLNLMVDISGSMEYSSASTSKFDYAMFLAASLAYLMIRQGDAVGLTLFDSEVRSRLPSRSTRGHLNRMLEEMERTTVGRGTNMAKPLHELAERKTKRGFVVLVSDLLGDIDEVVEGLKHFRFKGHDVIVFQVLDPNELSFDFSDMLEFEDLETGDKMLIESESAKEIYLENLNRYQSRLRRECSMLGIDLTTITTEQPLDFALFNFLASRARQSK